MSLRKAVLAQAASDRLVAAACKQQGVKWAQQERLHAAATDRAEARAAAAPLIEICGSCPILGECRSWAVLDEYTGIAAAAAWVNGAEKPVHWIPSHPQRTAS